MSTKGDLNLVFNLGDTLFVEKASVWGGGGGVPDK